MTFLLRARGGLALTSAVLWFGTVGVCSILLVSIPARWVGRERRLSWVSTWARVHSRIVLFLLRLGGARFTRRGSVCTDRPGLIVMNHQSVLDIPTIMLMAGPVFAGFVTRARYAHVPAIATGLWLADCPVIDPRQDREGAIATLRKAVQADRTLLIFPEGHRTPDGTLQPFRIAGLLAMLEARRVPVWVVVTDGFHTGRRVLDLLDLWRIDGITEVVGAFEPPADTADLPAFIDELHTRMAAHIAELRLRRKR